MSRPFDPSALRRLREPLPRNTAAPTPMGYQAGLDGLRSLAIVLVVGYHAHVLGAGFGFAKGGFIGVEVFFVVSGYLITALLLDEWHASQRVDLRAFWMRRARRLLPALATMLVATAAAAAIWQADSLGRFRADLPGAVFYFSNWRQVFDSAGYFGTLGTPPLLRHLWSLAVEEQWYLVWPFVFSSIVRRAAGHIARVQKAILILAVISVISMPLVFREFDQTRTNFAYLSTLTRAGGLLLGSALATGWTPWRWPGAAHRHLVALDAAGFAAVLALVGLTVRLGNTSPGTYGTRLAVVGGPAVLPGGLFAVSVCSVVAIAAAVHPGAHLMHTVFANRYLAAFGKRSYGLYLWHWPIFVLFRVGESSTRLAVAVLVTAVVTECSFRFVEQPVRTGALRRWFGGLWATHGADRQRWTIATAMYALAAVMVVAAVGVRLARAETVSVEVDRSDVRFDPAVLSGPIVTAAPELPGTAVAPSTTAPRLPRRLVIVGDSQAHSLAVNAPLGLDGTFTISNGSIPGCSVWESGSVSTERRGVTKNFGGCDKLPARWKAAAIDATAEVALVTLGAWDVFDVDIDDTSLAFASQEFDRQFVFRLGLGIEALKLAGAHVALLEVPCMRPVDVAGAAVPALPERGDDSRVAHLNELLRQVAEDDPRFVTFVAGPAQWCTDEAIASDVAYRWDGVHVYKKGAKLVFETIAPALLRIPV